MTRPKGRQSAKAVEKDLPHFVDMVIPLGGFGNRLDTMYEFHDRHGIEAKRGHGWPRPKKGPQLYSVVFRGSGYSRRVREGVWPGNVE